MRYFIKELAFDPGYATYSQYSETIPTASLGVDCYSISMICSNYTGPDRVVPSAQINATTNRFYYSDHAFATGQSCTLTTSSALPAPLLVATTYYIIKVDVDYFQLATSLANAIAGTAIDLTNVGVGDQTVDVGAVAGGYAGIQESNDGVTWAWTAVQQALSGGISQNLVMGTLDRPAAKYHRIAVTVTNGIVGGDCILIAKSDVA